MNLIHFQLVYSEFVQWLVDNHDAKSVDEAIMLGQALLDCGILHHGKNSKCGSNLSKTNQRYFE